MVPRPDQEAAISRLYRKYHVCCSVTGEKILLDDLRYWCIATGKVYARPELMY